MFYDPLCLSYVMKTNLSLNRKIERTLGHWVQKTCYNIINDFSSNINQLWFITQKNII